MVSLGGNNHNVAAVRRREGEGGGRERLIAVAIDRDKTSRYALKWAIENIVSSRNRTLKLVHVKCRPSTSSPFPALSEETQPDAQTTKLFLPFRCYCLRRHVQSEVVVLEDSDVAKALVEYVSRHAVDTLLLGSASRKSISRLFKFSDTPNTILKYAPDFCNIYVVGKGKAVSVRSATRPIPNLWTIEETAQVNTLDNSSLSSQTYDELSTCENDLSRANSGRLSTDSSFLSFYEDLGFGCISDSLASLPFEDNKRSMRSNEFHLSPASEPATTQDGEGSMLWSSPTAEAVEEEMLRIKLELQRTIDLYHAACKEAIRVNQTVMDCHKYQNELEKKLLEARWSEQAALTAIEKEREKFKVGAKAWRLAGAEAAKSLDAEEKAHQDVGYRSLVHIMVVLMFFYVYFIYQK
ncbi:hypothetical protein NL676_034852 [Syzygium grande]|nr:hypothetical protein NL676_034852 [Syzygium grande]